MYVYLLIFLRAHFAFHISINILLYLLYFNKLPFNSSSLLNLFHFTLLDKFCIIKLFCEGSHRIKFAKMLDFCWTCFLSLIIILNTFINPFNNEDLKEASWNHTM